MTNIIATIVTDAQSQREVRMAKVNLSAKIGFLRTGWWIVHVAGITLVYVLGHLAGR